MLYSKSNINGTNHISPVINTNASLNNLFISKNDKNEAFAVSLSELVSVDASKVIPINDLFYEKHQPDTDKLPVFKHP